MIEECCCFDSCDDGDPCTVLLEIERTARKQHICGECSEIIEPGQRYEEIRLKCGKSMSTHKTCIPCTGIRRDFFQCGYAYGCIRDDFQCCNGFDYVNGEVTDDD